jgi:hypothetical protein
MMHSAARAAPTRAARTAETPAPLARLHLLAAALLAVNAVLSGSLLIADDAYDTVSGVAPASLPGGHHAPGGLLQPVLGIGQTLHFSEADHQLGHAEAKGEPEHAAVSGVVPSDSGFEPPDVSSGSRVARALAEPFTGEELPRDLLGRPPPA